MLWQASATGADPYLCIEGLSMKKSKEIFVGYLVTHEKDLSNPAGVLLMQALPKGPSSAKARPLR